MAGTPYPKKAAHFDIPAFPLFEQTSIKDFEKSTSLTDPNNFDLNFRKYASQENYNRFEHHQQKEEWVNLSMCW